MTTRFLPRSTFLAALAASSTGRMSGSICLCTWTPMCRPTWPPLRRGRVYPSPISPMTCSRKTLPSWRPGNKPDARLGRPIHAERMHVWQCASGRQRRMTVDRSIPPLDRAAHRGGLRSRAAAVSSWVGAGHQRPGLRDRARSPGLLPTVAACGSPSVGALGLESPGFVDAVAGELRIEQVAQPVT